MVAIYLLRVASVGQAWMGGCCHQGCLLLGIVVEHLFLFFKTICRDVLTELDCCHLISAAVFLEIYE